MKGVFSIILYYILNNTCLSPATGFQCTLPFDIQHSWCSSSPSLMWFRFPCEPGEGSAACSVELENKLEYGNGTVRTELPFILLLTAEHSPFQGNLFLYGSVRCCWSKAVGKAWEHYFLHVSPWRPPNVSLPQSSADRVYRDWDRLYIPLASIWKSDH